MAKNKHSYFRDIRTFEDIENEKLRLYYQLKLSEKKLEVSLLEINQMLHPIRWISTLISNHFKPMIEDFFERLIKGKKHDQTSTD